MIYLNYKTRKLMLKEIEGAQVGYFIPAMVLVTLLLSKVNIYNNYSQQYRTKLIGIVRLITQIYVILSTIIVPSFKTNKKGEIKNEKSINVWNIRFVTLWTH